MTNRMRYREILWDSRWFKFDNILSFYFQILQYNLYRYNTVQEQCVGLYQDKRVYLDEYPEQKELRRNWLGDWYSKTKWLFQINNNMNRFSEIIKSAGFEDDNFPDWGNSETVSGCKFYDFQMKFAEEITDTYYERRWLRRN